MFIQLILQGNPLGSSFGCVESANHMVVRVLGLLFMAASVGTFWVLEQPRGIYRLIREEVADMITYGPNSTHFYRMGSYTTTTRQHHGRTPCVPNAFVSHVHVHKHTILMQDRLRLNMTVNE